MACTRIAPLSTAAVAGVALCAASIAAAQADASDVRSVGKVDVTGSNIKRTDIETALPVQVLTREDIERTGLVDAAALMSLVSANLVGATDAIYRANPKAGLSSANLRGLGDDATLVLLNGRRAANYAVSGGAFNLNFIPLAAIERIEILKDGASAIYGADAVAGVVNFILRKDFAGASLSGYLAQPEQGGGEQREATAALGAGDVAKDGFNVFAVASHQRNDALPAQERSFSRTAYRPDEGISNLSRETFPANVRTGPFTWANPAYAAGCMPPISVPIEGTGRCGHDPLGFVNLLPPSERTQVLAGATVRLGAGQQLFAQYLYARNRYVLVRNPASTSESGGAALVYPADGPYYPREFAAAHGLAGDLDVYYRAVPLGPMTDQAFSDADHLVVGAEGVVAGWNYDAAWVRSVNTQQYETVRGQVSAQRLAAAVATGLVNPFGASGPEGVALLAGAEVTGRVYDAKGVTDSLEVKASRDLATIAGGAVAFAAGINVRRESLEIGASPELNAGDVTGSLAGWQSMSGSRDAAALYAELNVPLAKSVEAQLAIRYDHYSDFGGSTNPKIALRWQPDAAWLFRSSYGTGFRAPTLTDLYAPPFSRASRFIPRDDPRRCPVTGLPADCNASFRVVLGGDPNLDAEDSWQLNLGAVWAPAAGVSLGLDYWKVALTGNIGSLDYDIVFNDFARFESTNVVRGPVDAAFPGLPGPIRYVFLGRQNLGALYTSGLDFDVRYRGEPGPFGAFDVAFNGTYVAQWEQQLDGVSYVSAVGRSVVGAVPRWRHYLAFGWANGPWRAALTQSYASGYTDVNYDASENERRVGAYDIWSAQASYAGVKDVAITVGMRNLFDRAPPFSNQTTLGLLMYDPRYADPRGRTFYAKLAIGFP